MTIWFLAGLFDSPLLIQLPIQSFGFSPTLLWLLVGAILCSIELVVPTAFTAFMMGISAFVVALLVMLLPLPAALQVVLWLVFSIAFVYLSHRLMPRRKVSSIEDATEGQTLTEILPGEMGRVLYEGNSWKARCEDEKLAIAPNQRVYVVRREGTTLVVLPEHLLKS
jgi:membrane protein implicated in regulation of membrane protease activity